MLLCAERAGVNECQEADPNYRLRHLPHFFSQRRAFLHTFCVKRRQRTTPRPLSVASKADERRNRNLKTTQGVYMGKDLTTSRLCTRVTTRRRSPNPLRTPNRDPPMTPVQRRSSPARPTRPKPRHPRQRITSISLPCRSFQCVPLTKQRMLRKQENTTM